MQTFKRISFQTTTGKPVCWLKPIIVWYDYRPQERGGAQEQWKPEHKRKVSSPQSWLSAHCHYVENMKWNRGKLSKVVLVMVLCNVYMTVSIQRTVHLRYEWCAGRIVEDPQEKMHIFPCWEAPQMDQCWFSRLPFLSILKTSDVRVLLDAGKYAILQIAVRGDRGNTRNIMFDHQWYAIAAEFCCGCSSSPRRDHHGLGKDV